MNDTVDMTSSIVPRSDQMNSDDLISGPRTVRITKVSADHGSAEQPILVNYEGDGGKPYKPCKSMRRVMVTIWGSDGAQFVGKSMTLYRDPDVTWGGMKVGGIRISHMSDMDGPVTMALTATKQSRKPFTVKPLVVVSRAEQYAERVTAALAKFTDAAKLTAWWNSEKETGLRERAGLGSADLSALAEKVTSRTNELTKE